MSGSQVEMQALRAAFERGEEPLAHVRDASDINSVSAARAMARVRDRSRDVTMRACVRRCAGC